MLPLKCKFSYIYQTETVGSAQSVNSFTDVNAEISLTGNIQRLAVHRVQRSYSQRSHVNSLKLFVVVVVVAFIKSGECLSIFDKSDIRPKRSSSNHKQKFDSMFMTRNS